MKTLVVCLITANLLLFMNTKAEAQEGPLDADQIYGKWFILYSNFPMWTSGTRVAPSLNYSPNQSDGEYAIDDVVMFTKNGRHQTIKGKNKVASRTDREFVWKGNGLLSLLKSKWKIVHFEKEWMIIYFEKTLFTPAGYDVVAKTLDLKETQKSQIKQVMTKIGISDLTPIPH